MIKINVITTNRGWHQYIKNPNDFVDKKISIYNKKNKTFKKIADNTLKNYKCY